MKRITNPELCKGCALGGTRREHREGVTVRRRVPKQGHEAPSFYGQCVYSDTCSGFPKSFPHGSTGMVSFCDEYTGHRDFYFVCRPHDPGEVGSAIKKYHSSIKHHLKDDKIWVWKTDNRSEFRAGVIDGPGGLIEELVKEKHYSVPNVKNPNPFAERAWGVVQRGIRTCHAHAEAPACL